MKVFKKNEGEKVINRVWISFSIGRKWLDVLREWS